MFLHSPFVFLNAPFAIHNDAKKISWLYATHNGHCTKRNSLFAVYNGLFAIYKGPFAIYNGHCATQNLLFATQKRHFTTPNALFAIYNKAEEIVKVFLQPVMTIVKREIHHSQFTMGCLQFTMVIVNAKFTICNLQWTIYNLQ